MSSRTCGIGPFRVITQQYVLSFKNQQLEDTRANVFPTGCPNTRFSIPFFCGLTKNTSTLLTRSVRSKNLKFFLKRLRSRRFVNSHGKHLTVSVRNSQSPQLLCVPAEIDILGHACDVVRHGNLLKNVDFRRLSQIIENLTFENLAEREAEITNLPWTQTEKDTALARCRSGQRAWRNKKPVLCLTAVTDEEGHPLENEHESGRRFCEYWRPIFQAREEGPRHRQHEDIFRYVQQALDDISWTNDQVEFDDLLALKRDSAPGSDRIPFGAYRCAGGLGSKFLFNVYTAVLEGNAIPDCCAESRTVFIPKTSDIDDNGRIIRSPDALRPLTLCNCDCKLHTSAICRGLHWYTKRCIHPSQRCISSRQTTDNIFEIETTALAHVACAPQESGFLLADFAAAYPSGTLGCPVFSAASSEVSSATASLTFNSREHTEDNSIWPEVYDRVVLRVVFFLQWPSTRSSDGSRSQLSHGTLTT